ncbi:MAG: insulinase family protein [Desulfuromonas sp.]|nr:MAG: insulinase family protein [Desulfuromonas sp.]
MNRQYKITLENGLRIVCVPQPHLHACEVSCYIGVGSRYETEKQAGISHFLEHMLFRGTAEYPNSLELEKAFEALGGGANAMTDAESTCYFSRFHPEKVAEGLALFASMLQRPLFGDIETERKIILEEAREDFNEKGELINPDSLMARLIWPDTPLAQPTIGSVETIASVDAQMLRQHHQRFYSPVNTVIAVAGRVEPEVVFLAAERSFGKWQGEAVPQQQKIETSCGERSSWVKDSASQLSVQMALPIPGRESRHALALRILQRILSGGVASRLMMQLRENLGLTYSIEANLTSLRETGALVIDFMVTPDNLVAAVREVCGVLSDLFRTRVPEEELARIVQGYRYDLDFSNDHPDEMVVRYGWGELVGFVRDIEADRTALEQLTTDALTSALAQALDPDQLRLVVVGPWRQSDRPQVEQIVRQFARPVS